MSHEEIDDDFPVDEPVEGPYGKAEPNPPSDYPDIPQAATTVAHYLITAPQYHPLWSQYILAVVSLRESEGLPPPHLQFEGATHELLVYALNPDNVWTVESMTEQIKSQKGIPYLLPINICHQFTATDEEMQKVAWLACRAVVHGGLNPETADAPTRIRESWLAAVVKTLGHLRGEEHAP